MTKREKESNEILSQIYNLVLNPDINTYKRTPLLNAKNRLEKNEYFPRVMKDLEFDLRPYAIKSKLSSSVAKFYMSASTAGKFDRELGRGLAATSITFGSIL